MFNSSLSQPMVWGWYANNGYSAACKMCSISLYDLSINSKPGPPATLGVVLGMTVSDGLQFLPMKRYFLGSLKISAEGRGQLWSWDVWSIWVWAWKVLRLCTHLRIFRKNLQGGPRGALKIGTSQNSYDVAQHIHGPQCTSQFQRVGRDLITLLQLTRHACGISVYLQANTRSTC